MAHIRWGSCVPMGTSGPQGDGGQPAFQEQGNGTLKDLIAQLKEDIASAKAERQLVEKAKAEATKEACWTKEDAKARTSAQTNALKKMEFSLRGEMQTRGSLNTQMDN